MNVSVHANRSDGLLRRHLPGNHQVGNGQRGRPRDAHQAVHEHSTSAVDAVLNELGRYVEVPRDIRGWSVRQRKAHVAAEEEE